MPSFAFAVARGARYLEMDVHATSDGTVVVIHDSTLDRTTDGQGAVAAHTSEQITRLDAGYWFTHDGESFPYRGQGIRVPTLDSVLSAFPDQCFNIEIKQEAPPIVDAVVRVLECAGARDRVLLAAQRDSIMNTIRKAVGNQFATGMSVGDVTEFMDRFARNDWEDYRPPGRALQIPTRFEEIELVTRETVSAAHRVGLEVHVWTINDAAEIQRLLDLGVDGIMSDLPDLVTAAISPG